MTDGGSVEALGLLVKGMDMPFPCPAKAKRERKG